APSGQFGQIGALGVGCEDGPILSPHPPHRIDVGNKRLAILSSRPSADHSLRGQFATGDDADVQVFDLAGRRVARQRITASESTTSSVALPRGLPNGLYLVRITQGTQTASGRLILLN